MFKVYQIHPQQAVYESVNSVGHIEAGKQFPIWKAKLDIMSGSEGFTPEYSTHYSHVADIDAEDLERVFHVGNMGPESAITRHSRMHSVSVGDIVVDESGQGYMVDPVGFSPVEFSV